MSEQNPVYTGNKFEQFLEHVGHDLHVAFSVADSVVTKLPVVIKDVQTDAPRFVPLVQDVVAASVALAKAAVPVETAVGALGANVPADLAALGDVTPLEAAFKALVASIKALALEIGLDWQALETDLLGTPATAAAK